MKTTTVPIPPPPEVPRAASVAVGPPTQTGGGPSRLIDLTGQRFGRLVVLSRAENDRWNQTRWRVRCDCGNERLVSGKCLRQGRSTSCGCLRSEKLQARYENISGKRYGKLIAVSRVPFSAKKNSVCWNCICDCGNNTIVKYGNLRSGHTTSCGCAKSDAGRLLVKDLSGLRFGRLVVLQEEPGRTNQRNVRWRCKCDCGTLCVVASPHLLNGYTSSCGCYQKEQRREANINPTLTDEDRIRKRLRTQKELRKVPTLSHVALAQATFRRDNYTCISCGKRGVRLAAHHIEPWALRKDLRYNLANLVTLCSECHKQFHKLYGNDVSLDDFEDYLKP